MNKEKLTELVFINLGRASMCWSEIPRGVFDSTKAAELGKEIMEAIEKYVEEDKEPGWVDPMMEMLDREEKESEWQRRRRLDVMEAKKKEVADEREKERELIGKIIKEGTPDGHDDNFNPRYMYEGFTYILTIRDEATRILGVEVPAAQVERHWLMEDLQEQQAAWDRIKDSGTKKKK